MSSTNERFHTGTHCIRVTNPSDHDASVVWCWCVFTLAPAESPICTLAHTYAGCGDSRVGVWWLFRPRCVRCVESRPAIRHLCDTRVSSSSGEPLNTMSQHSVVIYEEILYTPAVGELQQAGVYKRGVESGFGISLWWFVTSHTYRMSALLDFLVWMCDTVRVKWSNANSIKTWPPPMMHCVCYSIYSCWLGSRFTALDKNKIHWQLKCSGRCYN